LAQKALKKKDKKLHEVCVDRRRLCDTALTQSQKMEIFDNLRRGFVEFNGELMEDIDTFLEQRQDHVDPAVLAVRMEQL
jgi:hypothetical protein